MSSETVFQRLARVRGLRRVAAIFHTLDGIVFGTLHTTSIAPHLRDHIEIKRYMALVILALLPSTIAAVSYFGSAVLSMILVSYVCGGIVEVAFAIIRKREIEEGFLVTGLIFPLVLPPTTPLWVVAVGIVFGVFFGKEVFGGTGRNIFNPALVGRLFITIAFPEMMSATWRAPYTDVITSATPLGLFKTSGQLVPIRDLLLGLTPGSTGELFRVGIIAGGIFLMVTRTANWRVPLTYIAAAALASWAGSRFAPVLVAPPAYQLLMGGLLFGAFFMATDPVSSPITKTGKHIFGAALGFLTVIIRALSGYTEGVMFSIVFMNAFVPLIDHAVLRVKYRAVKS